MAFSLLVLGEGFGVAERIFSIAALYVFVSILAHGFAYARLEFGRYPWRRACS